MQSLLRVGIRGIGVGAVILVLLAAQAAVPTLTIDNTTFIFVSSARVSRTLFDFTYRAKITNTSITNMTGVVATLTSLSSHTVVVQGTLTFGDVPAGHTVTSTDTFTIRHDRTFPWRSQDLIWQITGTPKAPANRPPVANAGPDQTVFVGTQVQLDGHQSSDADGDSLHYQWAFLSTPPGSSAALSDLTALRPTFTVDRPGTYEVQLVVNDGLVNSASDMVRISTKNSRPVANAGQAQTVAVGTQVQLDGSKSSDVDGDLLQFQWSFLDIPVGSTATLSDSAAVRPTFTVDRPGTYTAQLTVNDGTVDSAPAQVDIHTHNSPPVADAGPDQTFAVGDTVQLDGSQSRDVDGNILSYQWSFTSTPPGSLATLSDQSVVKPRFIVDHPGTYTVQLIVNDGTVNSLPDTVVIDTHNSRPVANAGPAQTVAVGTTVQLDGRLSSDADGDPLSYIWALTVLPTGSTATLSDPTAAQPTFVADQPDSYVAQLIVNDGQMASFPATISITAALPPQVSLDPADGALMNTSTPLLIITYQDTRHGIDLASMKVTLDNVDVTASFTISASQATYRATLADGVYQFAVSLQNLAGLPAQATAQFTIDTVPPPPISQAALTVGPVSNGEVTITGAAGSAEPKGQVSLTNTRTGLAVMVTTTTTGGFTAPLAAQLGDVLTLASIDAAGNTSAATTVTMVPPDPALLAPPNDPTVATTLYKSVQFLFNGAQPIQTGVAPTTISPVRIAVVRGRVLDRNNQPLPGVTITILDHPELGQTMSRADGMFDLAVNGGGALTVVYAKAGFFPAQRQVQSVWQDFARASDVVLVPWDARVTPIALQSATQIQVAQGSVVTDQDGTRQATLLFTPGTQASMTLQNGQTVPLSTLHVRATEYTVGSNGSLAMPAELPPTSAYTYAVELSVDEAMAAGATRVDFTQSVVLYIPNFLGFPVGIVVPVGFYDRVKAQWVPGDSGRVVQVVSVANGVAEIDTDGDGTADNDPALSFTLAERQTLAGLYAPGQSLWRVRVSHFSPLDTNWGPMLPPGAQPWQEKILPVTQEDDTDCAHGSLIDCQNQILGETLAVSGTPFTLNYRSDRVPGHLASRTLDIPLTVVSSPNVNLYPLVRVGVKLEAGHRVASVSGPPLSPATPNMRLAVTWDSRDVYNRPIQGRWTQNVEVTYYYDGFFGCRDRFGDVHRSNVACPTGTTPVYIRGREFPLKRSQAVPLQVWDARGTGLGAWSLDVHHVYDPVSRVLHLGTGEHRSAEGIGRIMTTIAGGGSQGDQDGLPAKEARLGLVGDLAVGPDGTVYFIAGQRVQKVGSNGLLATVAGQHVRGYAGDGGPAVQALLNEPTSIAVGLDNSLYIADSSNARIRKVHPAGIITTVAGTGVAGYNGDGLPADQSHLSASLHIAMGPDNNLYIADDGNHRLRRIEGDGRLYTLGGGWGSGIGCNREPGGPDLLLGAGLGAEGVVPAHAGRPEPLPALHERHGPYDGGTGRRRISGGESPGVFGQRGILRLSLGYAVAAVSHRVLHACRGEWD